MKKHSFDTLEQSENLEKNGFSTPQAKALTRLISDAITASHDDLVNRLATKHELQEVKEEMRIGFAELDKKIDVRILELDRKILKMTISLGIITVSSVTAVPSLLNWLS